MAPSQEFLAPMVKALRKGVRLLKNVRRIEHIGLSTLGNDNSTKSAGQMSSTENTDGVSLIVKSSRSFVRLSLEQHRRQNLLAR